MRQRRTKSLEQHGYRLTHTSGKSRMTRKKGFTKGDVVVDTESIKIFSKNVTAFKITFGSKNIRPLIEANANNIVVPRVRKSIKEGLKDHTYISKKGRSVKILKGNMRKSFQVLTHRKAFMADNVVFVGPKALFKGGTAKTYGRSPKNANAYYAPAKESKDPQILPAMRSITPTFLAANANAIAQMMR